MLEQISVNPPPDTMWGLEEALEVIRAVQETFWGTGYCISLGGGVLNHGWSTKDLDLVVCPAVNSDRGLPDAFEAMNQFPTLGNLGNKYAWVFIGYETFGELSLVKFTDFHSEKIIEFSFVTETNLGRYFTPSTIS